MKLRILVQTTDITAVANMGGPVVTTCRTFDLEATPALAEHVAGGLGDVPGTYLYRQIIGVELVADPDRAGEAVS